MILQVALAAFFAELIDRRKPWTDQQFENIKPKFHETAKIMNEQRLTEMHDGQLNNLKLFLAQTGSAQKRTECKNGRQYFLLISNVIGWFYVFLIFCVLGKHKMERMIEEMRVKVFKYIATHRESLFCRRIEDKTIQFRSQENRMSFNSLLLCVLNYCRYPSRGSKKRKRRKSTSGKNIETKDQQSVNLTGAVTDERSILTDFSPSVFERFISDPVILSKVQAKLQKNQVAALPRPLERFHDLPHNINLSRPNESILEAARSSSPICENGKHNLDGEFFTKPAINLSISNTQVGTLSDAETFFISRDSNINNVTPGEPG